MAIILNGNNAPTAGAVAVGDGTTLAFTSAGTSGQILQSNGASAPTWVNSSSGGGMTLLSTTTLSGSTTNIGVTSGYVHLYIVSYGVTFSVNAELYFRITGVGSPIYDLTGTNARSSSVNNNLNDSIWSAAPAMPSRLSSSTANIDTYFIQNYASSSMFKIANLTAAYLDSTSTTQFGAQTGILRSTAAITSVSFLPSGGTFSGGTVLIYGVK
jgi:hypothetical protein